MLIGYMRVSKADGSQVLDLQRDALLAAGVKRSRFYDDRASGKRDDRPGLEACLKALREGDTLVVWKLDRLGRSLPHLVNTVHGLMERKVGFRVLTGQGANIDTRTASGRLVFGIFASLAEFERELIRERTIAGLMSARARGRNGGRPYKMTIPKLRLAQAAMAKRDTRVGDLCQELGVTRQTLYRFVTPKGGLREDARKLLKRVKGKASSPRRLRTHRGKQPRSAGRLLSKGKLRRRQKSSKGKAS
jgi:DNA invertase Pin-like site-specific DNA recombinase